MMKVFYDLFIRNIASYVYSYAQTNRKERYMMVTIKLIWETIPNPKWSKKGKDDEWIPVYNDKGKLKMVSISKSQTYFTYMM